MEREQNLEGEILSKGNKKTCSKRRRDGRERITKG